MTPTTSARLPPTAVTSPSHTTLSPTPRAYTALFELSNLLDTGLDREALAILVELCESGVNPEALAKVVIELRRESEILRASSQTEET